MRCMKNEIKKHANFMGYRKITCKVDGSAIKMFTYRFLPGSVPKYICCIWSELIPSPFGMLNGDFNCDGM